MLEWLNMDLSVIGGHLHTAKLSAGLCYASAIIILSTIFDVEMNGDVLKLRMD